MSGMTRTAVPARTWTQVHAAGGTSVSVFPHGDAPCYFNVGAAAPAVPPVARVAAGDVPASAPFMALPRGQATAMELSAGDKVFVYFDDSLATYSVTVWS